MLFIEYRKDQKIMELQTSSQVSQDYNISTRMLRYYEQIGLLESNRRDDYAYRVYDEDAIKRLQQIIILRKLQIPIKQIRDILNNQDAVAVIEIFKQNITELDSEITALSTIKKILNGFINELKQYTIHYKTIYHLIRKAYSLNPIPEYRYFLLKSLCKARMNDVVKCFRVIKDKDKKKAQSRAKTATV